MSEPSYRPGTFVWRELLTSDVDASIRFYGEVFGWKAETAEMPDGTSYTTLRAGEVGVGGLMRVPVLGIPPHWFGYISVADVEATADAATAAGGSVLAGPMPAGSHGEFVTFRDPQGGVIGGWRGAAGDGSAATGDVGTFCWEQLNSADPEGAFPFYASLFGWTKRPLGSGGAGLQVMCAGATEVASLMPAPAGTPAHWLSYVVVDALADAEARVVRAGGKVHVERAGVGDLGWIGVVADDVGAVIGVFEPKPAPKTA
jgi:predicted enzyme related to lactoylglutathione lyase